MKRNFVTRHLALSLGCVAALSLGAVSSASAAGNGIRLMSTDKNGVQGNDGSYAPVFSPDGVSIAFHSYATNLVPGDTNKSGDVFIKNLATGAITLVSTTATGGLANGSSWGPVFSPRGDRLAFTSIATNLVSGDANTASDVFLKTLQVPKLTVPTATAPGLVGAIRVVSTNSSGRIGNSSSGEPAFSPDGNLIAFSSVAGNLTGGALLATSQIYTKNLTSGATAMISTTGAGARGDAGSYRPLFTQDGSGLVFETTATNLVTGTKGVREVLFKNLTTKAYKVVSSSAAGVVGKSTSTEAAVQNSVGLTFDTAPNRVASNLVAFTSYANNLVTTDTNLQADIYLKDLVSGVVTNVSTTSAGALSNGASAQAAISPNGRYVAFTSAATNLVTGDTNAVRDIFVKDLSIGTVTKITAAWDGSQSNGNSFAPVFSPNGLWIAFYSNATNLVNLSAIASATATVTGTNGAYHVYVAPAPNSCGMPAANGQVASAC